MEDDQGAVSHGSNARAALPAIARLDSACEACDDNDEGPVRAECDYHQPLLDFATAVP